MQDFSLRTLAYQDTCPHSHLYTYLNPGRFTNKDATILLSIENDLH